MLDQVAIIWRAGEDFEYSATTNNKTIKVKKGELFLGMPYTYAGGTLDAFLEYKSETDDKGIPVISGLNSELLSGSASKSRVGNDCSSAVALSWASIGNSLNPKTTNTKNMTVNNGYLRVGEYVSNDDVIIGTASVCVNNGEQKMYSSYSELKKGDAVITRNVSSGHTRMITEVEVVYESKGVIDGENSKVTVLEQTSGNITGGKVYYDETLKEDVRVFTGLNVEYSFKALFGGGYLPITCKELIDPSPLEEEKVTDSISNPTIEDIFSGEISCNYFMDSIYISIINSSGEVVSHCVGRVPRANKSLYNMARFTEDDPSGFMGKIDLSALPSGEYTCKVEVTTVTKKTFTVRNFNFSK